MSVSVVKDQDVAVVTVKTDRESMLPPLCQILRALCYSPALCSAGKTRMANGVVATLGAVQIMVGLFNIGLGPGRTSVHPNDLADLGAAYWLGAVFIVAGIVSVLADSRPSSCWAGFLVAMNIVGSIFAIFGIVLYAKDLLEFSVTWMCDDWYPDAHNSGSRCRYVAHFAQRLLSGMDISLIVLAVLQLCVSVALAALGIRALCCRGEEKGAGDAESHQPLLKEVLMTSPGA